MYIGKCLFSAWQWVVVFAQRQKTKIAKVRVARWHIFRPKIPIWVNFGGYSNGRC
jgi:hypothetical protein